MTLSIPRLLIAGTQSGSGKTSLTAGIARALVRRGMRPQVFKSGPDFLDPTYLSLAAGRPCYNLDGWMMGERHVRALFASACRGADIALIEGAMGLFDGADHTSLEGSAAQLAAWLGAPVLLAAPAGGAARSFAAMAHGFATFEKEAPVAGIIANRAGSEDHGRLLAASLDHAGLPPLVGAVPAKALPELPHRHLGLVTADGDSVPDGVFDQLASGIGRWLDLERILRIASSAPPLAAAPGDEELRPRESGLRLAVARDRAFHFYYQDNLDALARSGFELVFFSPLSDERLPEKTDALYLGGGYPELHARELSRNQTMRESVAAFCASGRPVYAECGGLMYLTRGLVEPDGARHDFAAVAPAWTKMRGRFKALGYVEAELTADSLFGRRGDTLRGHRFHYSELTDDPADAEGWDTVYTLRRKRDGQTEREGWRRGRVLASYAHLHFASRPGAARRFAELCVEARLA